MSCCCLSREYPENLSQIQEEVLLLEADMCVKEVEGAQGQESPYRQEKDCGGDGGGGGGGSRLLFDSLFDKHTYTQMHTQPHRSGGHSFLFPASGEKEGHSK